MDTFYDVMCLYLGKTSKGKDLVMQPGGDTPPARQLEQGVINAGKEDKIFFDKKLFP